MTITKSFSKKIVTIMLAAVMCLCMIATMSTTASAAGCGNWQSYWSGTPYCGGDKCGAFWVYPYNHLQTIYYERQCVDSQNNTYWEYKSEIEKLGCCD